MLNRSVWVIIPAAGVGARMQANRPKQYLPLVGKTVIEHTLNCFLQHPAIAGIVVVVSQEDPYWYDLAIAHSPFIHTVQGGKERADSVLNGLHFLHQQPFVQLDTWVMVHDAARPCLSQQDLNALLEATQHGIEEGAMLAVPVRDTMKRTQPDCSKIAYTEDRNGLWHALTPQIARFGVLYTALQQALEQGAMITDEASALEFAGLHPNLIEGDGRNIKITRPADLALAEFFLASIS